MLVASVLNHMCFRRCSLKVVVNRRNMQQGRLFYICTLIGQIVDFNKEYDTLHGMRNILIFDDLLVRMEGMLNWSKVVCTDTSSF